MRMNGSLGGQIYKLKQKSTMKRLLIIAILSLFPFNIFATEKVSFSQESKIEKNHKTEMKEVLKEIQDTCKNQNSLIKSALRFLRTTLKNLLLMEDRHRN